MIWFPLAGLRQAPIQMKKAEMTSKLYANPQPVALSTRKSRTTRVN
jgi:hypothetical protein